MYIALGNVNLIINSYTIMHSDCRELGSAQLPAVSVNKYLQCLFAEEWFVLPFHVVVFFTSHVSVPDFRSGMDTKVETGQYRVSYSQLICSSILFSLSLSPPPTYTLTMCKMHTHFSLSLKHTYTHILSLTHAHIIIYN